MSTCTRSNFSFRYSVATLAVTVVVMGGAGDNSAQILKEFDADYLQAPADGPDLSKAEQVTIDRTNEFRKEHGLPTLKTDRALAHAARYFAAYMARTDKYGHEADGNHPWDRASLHGYDYCLIAENIAYQFKSRGFSTEELGQEIFEGWKESPRHRDNMLHPHMTATGVAIGYSPRTDRYYAVQLFGRPKSAAIEFEVRNRTPDTIGYTVEVPGNGETPERRSFELPPRATMFHTRCSPPRIDWGWTENDDGVHARNDRTYVVTRMGEDYDVEEQAASK